MTPALTPEEIARAERLQAAVDIVKAKILADVPSAGDSQAGGLLDAYGSSKWTPSRQAGLDFSSWGDWEAWEHQAPRVGAMIPTGDWVAWDSASGQQIGFSDKSLMSAREQAEMLALIQNEGKQTRVVPAAGGFSRSRLVYADIKAQVDAQLSAMEGGGA